MKLTKATMDWLKAQSLSPNVDDVIKRDLRKFVREYENCPPKNYFGEVLKELRNEKNLTPAQAAEQTGMLSEDEWLGYETGKTQPTIDITIRIAGGLKMEPFDLINRSLDKSKYFFKKE